MVVEDMSHPLGKFPTWQYIYSRLGGWGSNEPNKSLSRIAARLETTISHDPKRCHMAVKYKTSNTQIWKIRQAYDCNYQPCLSCIVVTTTIPDAYTWQGNSISSRTLAGEVGQVRRQGGRGGSHLE